GTGVGRIVINSAAGSSYVPEVAVNADLCVEVVADDRVYGIGILLIGLNTAWAGDSRYYKHTCSDTGTVIGAVKYLIHIKGYGGCSGADGNSGAIGKGNPSFALG